MEKKEEVFEVKSRFIVGQEVFYIYGFGIKKGVVHLVSATVVKNSGAYRYCINNESNIVPSYDIFETLEEAKNVMVRRVLDMTV